ncbi:MAG: hypothetical protein ACI86H_001238, partial [bacterium]
KLTNNYNNQMKIENLSAGVTGFIDILGFGEKVKNADTFEDIEKIESDIKVIQENFGFKNKSKLETATQERSNKTVLAFSDCVIINIPLESEATKYSGDFNPLMSEIDDFGMAQGACVQESLFLRGGLELDWWYQEDSTLISKGLVAAVKREESANFPIIAICDKFYEYFANHEHRKQYMKEIDPIETLFRKYTDGENKFHYIDYISISLNSLDWADSKEQFDNVKKATSEEKEKIMSIGLDHNRKKWLTTHARNIEEAVKNTGSNKVKEKYRWLAKYHNEVAPLYSSDENCLCNV